MAPKLAPDQPTAQDSAPQPHHGLSNAAMVWSLFTFAGALFWFYDFWADYWLPGTFAFGMPFFSVFIVSLYFAAGRRITRFVRRALVVTAVAGCLVLLSGFSLREYRAVETVCDPDSYYKLLWHTTAMPWRIGDFVPCAVDLTRKRCDTLPENEGDYPPVFHMSKVLEQVHGISLEHRASLEERAHMVRMVREAACESSSQCCETVREFAAGKDWSHLPEDVAREFRHE